MFECEYPIVVSGSVSEVTPDKHT